MSKLKTARKKKPSEALKERAERKPRTRPVWSGTLSFGLVTIPVEMHASVREQGSSLRMLSPEGKPLKRRTVTAEGKPLRESDIARAFPLDDRMIVVSDEELDAVAPEQSRDISLASFVPAQQIGALYLERPYVLAPGGSGHKPYFLLADTMEKVGRAGIATFVMRGKQQLIAIYAVRGLLYAHTLRFSDEVRDPRALGLPIEEAPSGERMKAVKSALASLASSGAELTAPPKDVHQEKLNALVEKKRKAHRDMVRAPELPKETASASEVVDLIEVLKASLKEGPKQSARKRSA